MLSFEIKYATKLLCAPCLPHDMYCYLVFDRLFFQSRKRMLRERSKQLPTDDVLHGAVVPYRSRCIVLT